ncbi:MAG: peptidoglycan DD-metalloendopeptidase family protein [Clostridiales Family XIII bacterium]|jgi:murein DD-endopeptidase MepM/ murein hydrolase activator NlpD|nr:peptidoglycan DD-metalloendopeptidase family protein [Clostridiales Family XIII bacterium]
MSNKTKKLTVMNMRIGAVLIAFVFAFSFIAAVPVYGERDLGTVNDEIKDAKDEYESLKKEEEELKARIGTLETKVSETESAIRETDAQIGEYNAKIEQISIEVEKMEKKVDDQNSDLNKRLRIMYESGDNSIIGVLLGSENIVDFLANLEMIKKIHKSDEDLLDELSRILDEVQAKKDEMVQIEQMLEVQKNEQVNRKASLEVDKVELAAAQAKVHELKLDALEDLTNLQAESARIQASLAGRDAGFVYGNGVLSMPCNGPITSEFGWRTNPTGSGSQLHAGMDIAVPTGTPIYAAADGVVISAGWNSGGYGNLVRLSNGNLPDGRGELVTCYAHNSSVAVSDGQRVTRGQVIAYAGSTGDSTGPHCHFEVRINGVPQNPRAWL